MGWSVSVNFTSCFLASIGEDSCWERMDVTVVGTDQPTLLCPQKKLTPGLA